MQYLTITNAPIYTATVCIYLCLLRSMPCTITLLSYPVSIISPVIKPFCLVASWSCVCISDMSASSSIIDIYGITEKCHTTHTILKELQWPVKNRLFRFWHQPWWYILLVTCNFITQSYLLLATLNMSLV